jgi:hypothetical protein
MLTYSVLAVLLHDNLCLHTTAHTRALLEPFNWKLSDHPPYSLILLRATTTVCLPEELATITGLQQYWGVDGRCQNLAELTGFFDIGIQKLIPLYDKCLNSSSDYFEKQLKYIRMFCT